MEILEKFSENWLEVVTAVYLVGMVLYGHYRGFIRLAVSAAALLITLVGVRFLVPEITNWMKTNTSVYEAIRENVEEAVGFNGFTGEEEETEGPENGKAQERMEIEQMAIPDQLKKLLIDNNNSEVYESMGVSLFREYVSGYLADIIIRTGVFLLLFFVIYLVLHVVVVWLDLIARLPILYGMNKLAGAILGGAEALIFIWVACLGFTALSGTEFGGAVMKQLDASAWLSWIYDHNMLSYLVLGMIHSLI